MKTLRWLAAVGAVVVAGCAAAGGGAQGSDGKADNSVGDRAALGIAQEYVPDSSLAAREDELSRSLVARREVAWQSLAKILAPVPIAGCPDEIRDLEGASEVCARAAEGKVALWQTWYDNSDVSRMFQHLYAERANPAPFTVTDIEDAFAWNATQVLRTDSWPLERYLDHLRELDEPAEFGKLGGDFRVGYSPGVLRHLYSNYQQVVDCPGAPGDCVITEFPISAALVKAQWVRAGSGALPEYDTTVAGLTDSISDYQEWQSIPPAFDEPDADRIYTIRDKEGNEYQLAALHLMTKELRHWQWITMWWSPQPDTTYGADRPAEIQGVWRNYQMCAVTAFAENDPQPGTGLPSSLSQAAALTHEGVGGPSWCSNPYLEKGRGNAKTNCVGCHQHAGTSVQQADIYGGTAAFPMNGRTQIRTEFSDDYLYALTVLRAIMQGEVDYWR